MPVARSTDVRLSELDLAAIADFTQSPIPLFPYGDEEISLTQRAFTDVSHAFVTGTRQELCYRHQPRRQ